MSARSPEATPGVAAPRSDLGMYATKDLVGAVPPERRAEYLRAVEEFARRKYQLGVAVARRLPPLYAERPDAVGPYLEALRRLADADWRVAVEAARTLHLLQQAPDARVAEGYEAIVAAAAGAGEEDMSDAERELAALDAELAGREARMARADELRTHLAARAARNAKRQDQAARLARALPAALRRVRADRQGSYMERVGEVAAADPEASVQAAESLVELLNAGRLSSEGAAEWVLRGLEALGGNAEVGRGYFRLATKQSLQVVEELKEGLALRSVARVLKLYATALSGSEVAIRGTDEMDAVNAFGADHIILPPDMRFFEDDERNFTAYKVATAHGAGRIEFGTYRFALEEIPETVARLRARYGTGDEA